MWDIRNRDLARTPTGTMTLGQGDVATLLQFQKEAATGHVFNPAIGGMPIPQKAQLPGNPTAILGWVSFNQPAD